MKHLTLFKWMIKKQGIALTQKNLCLRGFEWTIDNQGITLTQKNLFLTGFEWMIDKQGITSTQMTSCVNISSIWINLIWMIYSSLVGQNKKPITQLSFIGLIVSFDRPCMSSFHPNLLVSSIVNFFIPLGLYSLMKITLHSLALWWCSHSSLRGHP